MRCFFFQLHLDNSFGGKTTAYSSANLLDHYGWNLELKYEDCPRLVYTNGCFFYSHLEYFTLFLIKAGPNLSKFVRERESTRIMNCLKEKHGQLVVVYQSKMILLILHQLYMTTFSCRADFFMFRILFTFLHAMRGLRFGLE